MLLKYAVFMRCNVDDAAVKQVRNASYPGRAAYGFLTVIDGTKTDSARIEDDVLAFWRRFCLLRVAFDCWAATQFAQHMLARDVAMVAFRAATQN